MVVDAECPDNLAHVSATRHGAYKIAGSPDCLIDLTGLEEAGQTNLFVCVVQLPIQQCVLCRSRNSSECHGFGSSAGSQDVSVQTKSSITGSMP